MWEIKSNIILRKNNSIFFYQQIKAKLLYFWTNQNMTSFRHILANTSTYKKIEKLSSTNNWEVTNFYWQWANLSQFLTVNNYLKIFLRINLYLLNFIMNRHQTFSKHFMLLVWRYSKKETVFASVDTDLVS